jgi:hypothetical protein
MWATGHGLVSISLQHMGVGSVRRSSTLIGQPVVLVYIFQVIQIFSFEAVPIGLSAIFLYSCGYDDSSASKIKQLLRVSLPRHAVQNLGA